MSPIPLTSSRSASAWYRGAPYRRGITAGQYLALAVLIVALSGLRSAMADDAAPSDAVPAQSDVTR